MKKLLFILVGLLFQSLSAQTNFEITPPKGWTAFGKPEIVKSLNQKYSVPDAKKQEIIQNNKSVEVARFMTNSKDGGYSPNLQVILRPNTAKDIDQFKSSIEKSIGSLKAVVQDFKILQPLTKTNVGGKDALIFKSEGYLQTKAGKKNQFRTILLLIPNGNTFYQITLNDTPTDSYEQEFKDVIASIKP